MSMPPTLDVDVEVPPFNDGFDPQLEIQADDQVEAEASADVDAEECSSTSASADSTASALSTIRLTVSDMEHLLDWLRYASPATALKADYQLGSSEGEDRGQPCGLTEYVLHCQERVLSATGRLEDEETACRGDACARHGDPLVLTSAIGGYMTAMRLSEAAFGILQEVVRGSEDKDSALAAIPLPPIRLGHLALARRPALLAVVAAAEASRDLLSQTKERLAAFFAVDERCRQSVCEDFLGSYRALLEAEHRRAERAVAARGAGGVSLSRDALASLSRSIGLC